MNRVDASIMLKDAALKVYGVLAVQTDPGCGGIESFDSGASIEKVTRALCEAHSAILYAVAAINNLD